MSVIHKSKLDRTAVASRAVIEEDFSVSAKTSIFRTQASVPLRYLFERGLIRGSVLNFGKGRYSTDSEAIITIAGNCTDYDYTYAPLDLALLGHNFHTVFAGYVANTLPRRSRDVIYAQIANATRLHDGRAYFAVRSDKDRGIKGEPFYDYDLNGQLIVDGVITSKGTYQIGFSCEQMLNELEGFFSYARVICYKSGYMIAECAHEPFADDSEQRQLSIV
ncbi:hypothetical protein QTV44_002482 [Vibrio vulnificus]|nr:hypothetical protein [Vibrio vulnificus]